MGDFDILYLCDRKACENCHEECKHTENIDHAIHRYDLNGRMFEAIETGFKVGFFEKED